MKSVNKNLFLSMKLITIFLAVMLVFNSFSVFSLPAKTVSLNKTEIKEAYTIVLDAGHGGVDGGASGEDGTLEKDLNLEIALILSDILQAAGYNVIMTRTEDMSMHTEGETIRQKKVSDMKYRLSVVQNTPGVVFLSIHMNKFPDPKYSGAQVFYSKNNPLSIEFAKYVQKSLKINIEPDNKRDIKPSDDSSYILKNTTAPAIIVECGFLSNFNELNNLKDNIYQKKLAFAILFGIVQYFNEKER